MSFERITDDWDTVREPIPNHDANVRRWFLQPHPCANSFTWDGLGLQYAKLRIMKGEEYKAYRAANGIRGVLSGQLMDEDCFFCHFGDTKESRTVWAQYSEKHSLTNFSPSEERYVTLPRWIIWIFDTSRYARQTEMDDV